MLKKSEIFILSGIIFLGLFLRLYFLKDLAISFQYDQARDAYSALEIVKGDMKIQGPPSSAPGIFHGVFYYYLIAPAYWLGAGNPVTTNIWLSIINIATIIPIFLFGRLLFSRKTGYLAAFLFSISLDAVQYANWMSNPSPALFSGAIFYLGLSMLIFKKRSNPALILTALGLGFSVQFEVFLGYLFVPLIISLSVFKIRPTLKEFVIFSATFLLAVSSMLISYIKFGFTIIPAISGLYSGNSDPYGSWREFFPMLGLYLNRFAEYFYRGLLPFNVTFAAFIGAVIIFWACRKIISREKLGDKLKFLLILLFSHAFLIAFGGSSTPFINAGLEIVVFTLVAVFIIGNFQKQKLWISLLLILIAFSSINAIFKFNPNGQTIFAIQRGMTLTNQLAAIDYTYSASGGKAFTINTVTLPLWINTTWAYLYNWYGMQKYGFVPSFHGRDQRGYLGDLPQASANDEIYFFILEPSDGIPGQFVENTVTYESSFSDIVEQKNFGGITVQKRKLTKPFSEINFIK